MKLLFILLYYSSLIGSDFTFTTTSEALKEDYVKADRYIMLMAHSEGVGHAFVGWGYNDVYRKQCIVPRLYGFYPSSHTKGVFSVLKKVEGQMKDDTHLLASKKIIVRVDYKTYKESIRIFDEWEKKISTREQEYTLLNENCIKFLQDVAKTIHLQAPDSTTTLPANYIDSLTTLNSMNRVEENIWEVDTRKDVNTSENSKGLSLWNIILELDLPHPKPKDPLSNLFQDHNF